jgi:hypothetical protein
MAKKQCATIAHHVVLEKLAVHIGDIDVVKKDKEKTLAVEIHLQRCLLIAVGPLIGKCDVNPIRFGQGEGR